MLPPPPLNLKVLDDLVDTEVGETVRTEVQNLSEEQKKIARENIGAQEEICGEEVTVYIEGEFLANASASLSVEEIKIFQELCEGDEDVELVVNGESYGLTPVGFSAGYYKMYWVDGPEAISYYSGGSSTSINFSNCPFSYTKGDTFKIQKTKIQKIPAKFLESAGLEPLILQGALYSQSETAALSLTPGETYSLILNKGYFNIRDEFEKGREIVLEFSSLINTRILKHFRLYCYSYLGEALCFSGFEVVDGGIGCFMAIVEDIFADSNEASSNFGEVYYTIIPETFFLPQIITVTPESSGDTVTYTSDKTFEEIQDLITNEIFVQATMYTRYYQLLNVSSSKITFQSMDGMYLNFISDGTITTDEPR